MEKKGSLNFKNNSSFNMYSYIRSNFFIILRLYKNKYLKVTACGVTASSQSLKDVRKSQEKSEAFLCPDIQVITLKY